MFGQRRISDKYARSGEDMLEVLADDIERYELMSSNETENVGSGGTSHNILDTLKHSTGRFVRISPEDCDEFLLENVNKNTQYKTNSDLKLFYMWAKENSEHREIKHIPPADLDGLLARMYLGLRKKDGGEYEPDTLTSIQNSIDRHIKSLKLQYCIKTDAVFSHSRRVLESKRKSLKAMGKGNKAAKAESLTEAEIQILYHKQVLGTGNPESLLYTVWLNNGVYFGLRGRQDHTNLLWGDIRLKKTSDGKEYLEFNERSTKTRNGAKAGDYRRVSPKMFAQEGNPNCPLRVYKEYKAHRPPDLNTDESRFYLRPIPCPSSDIWFSHQPIGKEKLGRIMNDIAEKGELMGRKVNHSTRKTFATTLVQAGLPPTEVAHLGGWKNIQTINEYSVPSVKQQEAASGVISSVLVPKDTNIPNSVQIKTSTPNGTYTSSLNSVSEKCADIALFEHKTVSKTNTCEQKVQMTDNPLSILAGATITGNVIVNLIPSRKRKYQMASYSTASSESSQEN